MRTKYGNRKIERDGIIFDSVKEYNRFRDLSLLEKAGKIENLQRQVKFVLIPAQREPDTVGKRGGIKIGKTIEKECAYIADFTYLVRTKTTDGILLELVVEDTKGYRTKDYIIKRKLMLWVHGIKIKEV
jgi:hypothetical protein